VVDEGWKVISFKLGEKRLKERNKNKIGAVRNTTQNSRSCHTRNKIGLHYKDKAVNTV
jgi:hypothetical protein